jgi:hypothetical protein
MDRDIYMGTYDTGEDAAHVYDFAVMSLRGGNAPTVTNFEKGAYLGADGTLLPVGAALPRLGRDQHEYVRDKLASAVVGAGGATEGGAAEGASDSDSDNGGGAGPASPEDPSAALMARPVPMRGPPPDAGPTSGGSAPSGHGQAPGAQQGSAAPQQPLPPQQQAQQQLPSAPPAKYLGGCMRVQAA